MSPSRYSSNGDNRIKVDLATQAITKGASLVSIYDANNLLDAAEVEGALQEIAANLIEHKEGYVLFKEAVGSGAKLLEINFLDLLMVRELESLSTEMDTGYWWDNLSDATKIQSIAGASVSVGKVITTTETSEVVWRNHEIGFLTNKITYYQKRTKTDDVVPVVTNVLAGANVISIKVATISIS